MPQRHIAFTICFSCNDYLNELARPCCCTELRTGNFSEKITEIKTDEQILTTGLHVRIFGYKVCYHKSSILFEIRAKMQHNALRMSLSDLVISARGPTTALVLISLDQKNSFSRHSAASMHSSSKSMLISANDDGDDNDDYDDEVLSKKLMKFPHICLAEHN